LSIVRAVISSDSTQCQYCSAMLQTVACPSCFGLMFVGNKFCPHCGAATAAVAEGRWRRMFAAMPGVNLQAVAVGGVQLEDCPHCGGIWVAVEAFNKICADRETQESAVKMPLPPAVAMEHPVRYLKCPQCANLMNRYDFANRSGVIMDKCKPHGICSIATIFAGSSNFIRAGGMDQAREHEIAELQEQRHAQEFARRGPLMTAVPTSYARDDSSSEHLLGGIASLLFNVLNERRSLGIADEFQLLAQSEIPTRSEKSPPAAIRIQGFEGSALLLVSRCLLRGVLCRDEGRSPLILLANGNLDVSGEDRATRFITLSLLISIDWPSEYLQCMW